MGRRRKQQEPTEPTENSGAEGASAGGQAPDQAAVPTGMTQNAGGHPAAELTPQMRQFIWGDRMRALDACNHVIAVERGKMKHIFNELKQELGITKKTVELVRLMKDDPDT